MVYGLWCAVCYFFLFFLRFASFIFIIIYTIYVYLVVTYSLLRYGSMYELRVFVHYNKVYGAIVIRHS